MKSKLFYSGILAMFWLPLYLYRAVRVIIPVPILRLPPHLYPLRIWHLIQAACL